MHKAKTRQAKAKQQPRMRGLSKFKRTEATRVTRAILDAGLSVQRVEIDPATGKIAVFPGKPSEETDASKNPWDDVLQNRGRQT